jgi:hypothetical protein
MDEKKNPPATDDDEDNPLSDRVLNVQHDARHASAADESDAGEVHDPSSRPIDLGRTDLWRGR